MRFLGLTLASGLAALAGACAPPAQLATPGLSPAEEEAVTVGARLAAFATAGAAGRAGQSLLVNDAYVMSAVRIQPTGEYQGGWEYTVVTSPGTGDHMTTFSTVRVWDNGAQGRRPKLKPER